MLRISTLALAISVILLPSLVTADEPAVELTISSDDVKPVPARVRWIPSRTRLFQNYYAPAPGRVSAPLYTAPVQVPPLVGQTYATYEPLMPHEMLYRHSRTYYRYYDGGRGLTRTRVVWWRGPIAPPLMGWIW